jgi:hypothetical protein
MIATSRVRKSGKVKHYYACTRNYKQSAPECGHLLNYDAITKAIVGHFAHLTPHLIEQMQADEYDRMISETKALTGQRGELIQERDRLDRELARLAEAVAVGGQLKALLQAMEVKQAERDVIAAKIEHAEGSEDGIREALAAWQNRMISLTLASVGGLAAALQHGESGRRLLTTMIKEPIIVSPRYSGDGEFLGWSYSGEAHLGRLVGDLKVCHRRTGSIRIS